MHFKKLVAFVLREFVAQVMNIPITSVTSDNIKNYIQDMSNQFLITDTVRCIFKVLFNKPKSTELEEYVCKWFRRPTTLIAVIYNNGQTANNKKLQYEECSYDNYNIKENEWKNLPTSVVFNPSSETIIDLKEVLQEYKYTTQNRKRKQNTSKRVKYDIDPFELFCKRFGRNDKQDKMMDNNVTVTGPSGEDDMVQTSEELNAAKEEIQTVINELKSFYQKQLVAMESIKKKLNNL